MKVSIIIPVFNAEKYVYKCIMSILFQSLEELEVIIINDGSTDSSGRICMELYRKFPNKIRYIEQENRGCSYARNVGITLAKGEYIAFVDSDDYVNKNTYLELYKKAKKESLDILIFGINYISIKKKALLKLQKNSKLEFLIYKNKVANPVNKLFRREFLKENKLYFNPKIKSAEDYLFCFESIIRAKKVGYINKAYYFYVYHQNNTIYDIKKRKDVILANKILYETLKESKFLESKEVQKIFIKNFRYLVIREIAILLSNREKIQDDIFKKYYRYYLIKISRLSFVNKREKLNLYKYFIISYCIRKMNLYKVILNIKRLCEWN